MKNMKKIVMGLVCALALVTASVMGTMAYLTSTDKVTNTFTVGNVQIKLDEAKANPDGSLVANADRVEANNYKLLPGHTYNKDPMVTVLKGSESSYVKMTVTFTKAAELDAIFATTTDGKADMTAIFKGYDDKTWLLKSVTENNNANTRTYEFWYKEAVAALNGDVALDALFDKIVVPTSITNAQLATIEGMTITVNAYAIQADGFENAEAAWAAYSK